MRLDKREFLMAATDQGLCYLQFQEGSKPWQVEGQVDEKAWLELTKWVSVQFPEFKLVNASDELVLYAEQIEEYLKGLRKEFTLPLDLKGTAFQRDVWQTLHAITHGHTWNYSQVAEALGRSTAVRAVGTAIGANPILIVVPCHRVVGKNGSLTGYRGGLPNKESLLRLEKSSPAKHDNELLINRS
ncbi:methylated-DNA--[protein]-cysteine S-methyltransferase [Paenibacillus sp. SYP-B3998]|uniref:methylated-DNA--[protein]-cysteine S-methyltransferase n=2 Tax=Paenibacillus sp. SYP-B3998 TaxID=2678564 RepID=A0A6G4A4P4_9BACL|nr:methylated-DNA--[protein]-cysteine S-methyltransferase [Paenibacillus sp. SYP-B3998]